MERPVQLPKSKSDTSRRRTVWDCGSSLYDSFELRSFENQLHTAMAVSRTLSMSGLSDRRPPPALAAVKKPPRITRALQKFFRSVFKAKLNNSNNRNATLDEKGEEEAFLKMEIPKERFYYIFYDKSAALSTIPEAPEPDAPATEGRKFVRRTKSLRVTVPTCAVGIY